jgi:ABC-type glutathione transport system ATPase component
VSTAVVDPSVRLDAVSKSYGMGSGRLDLVHSVDLALASGATTSLLGRSGGGWTWSWRRGPAPGPRRTARARDLLR